MYRPSQFREDRPEVLAAAISALHFATLVTFTGHHLVGSHIPMVLQEAESGLSLQGHVARGNLQWKDIDPAIPGLAIFLGPQSYISPTWYASKAEHGKVVPTWNYISVHVTGFISIHHDPEWLLKHIEELTTHNEAKLVHPWSIHDAPAEFINQLCNGIVGVSMKVTQIEGTWKMAQHRSQEDRSGVIVGLSKTGTDSARQVAEEMRRLEEGRVG